MATRLQYRQAAARTLGSLFTGTATAGSTTALLEATAWPFKSTLAQNERFEHYYLHTPSAAAADRVRTVATGGYDSLTGKLTVDQLYGVAPTNGMAFELINLLDPDTLHRLINEVLKLTPVTVEVTFNAATATARRHSLATAAPWLTDPDGVYQVGVLAAGDVRSDVDPFTRAARGKAFERGGVVYLEGPAFATTDTVYVLCARPAYTYCRAAAGTFGDLTAGLTAETDEAAVEEDWVAAGVKMLAWDELRELFWPGAGQTADAAVARAAARFWALSRDNWTEPARTFSPLRVWGVVGYGRTPVG